MPLATGAAIPTMQNPPAPETGPTVLVIEDDPIVSRLLSHTLTRRGFIVEIAADGQRAAELLKAMPPPAVVLLDVMLPYYNGFELIQLIRATNEWRHVPIIILTSMSQERSVVRALDAGANDCIAKPFRPEELIARVRRFTSLATA